MPAIQKERLITRSEFLHPYQPLAIPAKSKSGGISGEVIGLAGIEQKAVATVFFERPELVQGAALVRYLGILLEADCLVGGGERAFRARFESSRGAAGIGGCHRCDTEQQ